MKIILSIKPEFAKKIFDGSKNYEYRRRIFKNSKVTHVVVYASSPVGKIIGEFEIDTILDETIKKLWLLTKDSSGIDKGFFYKYFINRDKGYAIKIKNANLFDKEYDILERYGVKPPQSFLYLKE